MIRLLKLRPSSPFPEVAAQATLYRIAGPHTCKKEREKKGKVVLRSRSRMVRRDDGLNEGWGGGFTLLQADSHSQAKTPEKEAKKEKGGRARDSRLQRRTPSLAAREKLTNFRYSRGRRLCPTVSREVGKEVIEGGRGR